MFWPCETRTSTCRSFATISSGLYRFLAIAVLLDVKDIPQVGPLQWGWIRPEKSHPALVLSHVLVLGAAAGDDHPKRRRQRDRVHTDCARSGRKNALISSASCCGASSAGKWPPRRMRVHRVMLP